MNLFICENSAVVEVKLTQEIGWVTGRQDSLGGGRYYRVVHANSSGSRVSNWYPEHEISPLPPGDLRRPPGVPFVTAEAPPPPGGVGDEPGHIASQD